MSESRLGEYLDRVKADIEAGLCQPLEIARLGIKVQDLTTALATARAEIERLHHSNVHQDRMIHSMQKEINRKDAARGQLREALTKIVQYEGGAMTAECSITWLKFWARTALKEDGT